MTTDPASELVTVPLMDPERAAYLRATMLGTARVLLSAALADMAAGPSTGSSLQDRMAFGALRPWLPKLEGVLLSKLSEADPAALERIAGAVAWAIESVLEQAPGEPEPRHGIAWSEDGRPRLVPLAELAS